MGCVPAGGGAEPSRGLVVGSGQCVPSVRDRWLKAVLQGLGACAGTLVGMWNPGSVERLVSEWAIAPGASCVLGTVLRV